MENVHFFRICLLKILVSDIVCLQLYHLTSFSLSLPFFPHRYHGRINFFQLLAIRRILLKLSRVLVSAPYNNYKKFEDSIVRLILCLDVLFYCSVFLCQWRHLICKLVHGQCWRLMAKHRYLSVLPPNYLSFSRINSKISALNLEILAVSWFVVLFTKN